MVYQRLNHYPLKKTLISGRARVLDCEIKTDEKRGLDPVNKKKAT